MKKFFDWRQIYTIFFLCFLPFVALATSKETSAESSDGLQQREIKGLITDELGEPLPGVTILIKGIDDGAETDFDGHYRLLVKKGDVLSFTFLGFQQQEIQIGDDILKERVLNVKMKENQEKLEELVVTGYSSNKKITLTGSVVKVDSKSIGETGVTSLSNALQGLAPGVYFNQNSGFPGSRSDIRIRGATATPLYVIDEIISDEEEFNSLAPEEVENIIFLKDLATTAQYGSRGANGVVVVTTKAGADGKAKWKYRHSSGFSNRIKGAFGTWTIEEEMVYANRAIDYGNKKTNLNKAPGAEDVNNPPMYSASDLEKGKTAETYNLDDFTWKDPTTTSHDLSVSGSTKKVNYYLFGRLITNSGPYNNVSVQTANVRSKIKVQLWDNLKVNINASAEQNEGNRFFWQYDSGGMNNTTLPDFYRSTQKVSKLNPLYLDEDGNPKKGTERSKYPVMRDINWHPVELIDKGGYRKHLRTSARLRVNVEYALPFIKGLNAKLNWFKYKTYTRYKVYVKHNKFYNLRSPASDRFSYEKPLSSDLTAHTQSHAKETLYHDVDNIDNTLTNFHLTYNREFMEKHEVYANLIYEFARADANGLNTNQRDLLTDSDQIFATSTKSEDRWSSGYEYESGRVSYVGIIKYAFDDKYIFNYVARYDGSEKFAPENRFGLFSSYSVAWVLSRESFLRDVSWIDILKLRGSYGEVGSDSGVRRFAYQQTFRNASSYVFGNSLEKGITASTVPNKDISWSTTSSWNAGVDFDFFTNKLFGDFDVFYYKDEGILGSRIRSIPSTYGARFSAENYKSNERSGFDINLGTKGKIGELTYEVKANLGYAVDKILVLDEAKDIPAYRSRIGNTASRLWGYHAKHIIRDQKEADDLNAKGFTQWGRKIIIGTILYEDIRGENGKLGADGKIDSNDQEFLSDNATPRINYGFNINLKYKGFALNARFSGVGAYDKMVRTMNTRGGGVFQWGTLPYFSLWTDAWSKENPNGKYPRAARSWGDGEIGHLPSTFWMRNGAFLRLKQLDFGYTVPKEYLENLFVEGLSVSLSGSNLFTISGFDDKEGDVEQDTIDSFPIMRTYLVNATINF